MTREELLGLHNDLCRNARRIMEEKNKDYSGATGGVFANFKACEYLGVDPITGILMRITDKLSRVSSFVTRGELKVKGESVEDALLDIINYSILIAGMIKEDMDD